MEHLFNAAGPLSALQTIVGGLSGIQQVYLGIPLSRDPQVTATVTLAGQKVSVKNTSSLYRDGRYMVTFAYRLQDAPDVAETEMATLVDAFTAAWKNNRMLNDTCQDSTLDFSLTDRPEYQMDAAQENRIYPVIVECRQYDSFNPAQT